MADPKGILDKVELTLRGNLRGKTLLGEIVFTESDCESIAGVMRDVVNLMNPSRALVHFEGSWPIILSLWLTNEAFFNFAGGTYWPYVLEKIGIHDSNRYSSRFGQAFVRTLERFQLPRFRRLKTRLSYLGPILAHSGIPRSCLPEFFERVLPYASFLQITDAESFEELQRSVSQLYLRKPTERFIVFGDQIARDFVRRCIDLDHIRRTSGEVPNANEVGLPPRVVEAYSHWLERATRAIALGAQRRSFRRPALYVDSWQGVRLLLPAQRLGSGDRVLTYVIETNSGDTTQYESSCEPGEDLTSPEEVPLIEPFSSLKVRVLVNGTEEAVFSFKGVSQESPILFFSPLNDRLLPARAVVSGVIGVAHPSRWKLVACTSSNEWEPETIEQRGTLPFGWRALVARVVDLADAEEVFLVDDQDNRRFSSELSEAEVPRPRLIALAGSVDEARDVDFLFTGALPALQFSLARGQSRDELLASWSIDIRPAPDLERQAEPVCKHLRDLAVELVGDSIVQVRLDHPALLGEAGWGQFEVDAHGPIGQDARYTFRAVPKLDLVTDRFSWADDVAKAKLRVRIPPGASLRGASATEDPSEYEIETNQRSLRLHLELQGYQGRRWELPIDLRIPFPAWALRVPSQGGYFLAWSRHPIRLSLTEMEGLEPVLLARLETPLGIPGRAELVMRTPGGDLLRQDLTVDQHGHAQIDLTPFLAAARQRQTARLELAFALDLAVPAQLACVVLQRHWAPWELECNVQSNLVTVRWKEQIPIENRALLVESLLTPWEKGRLLAIPNDKTGEWSVPAETVAAEPGLYRASLGLQDTWSGAFQLADCDPAMVQIGQEAALARHPLFSDLGPDGYLYRLLLENHVGIGGSYERPPINGGAGADFAYRVLCARRTLSRGSDAGQLRHELDAIIAPLPPDLILAALGKNGDAIDPELALRLNLFTRSRLRRVRPGTFDVGALTPETIDRLWRGWSPLGIWADLHLPTDRQSEVEQRLLHHLGNEALQELSPLQEGSDLAFWEIWEIVGEADRANQKRVTLVVSQVPLGDDTPFDALRFNLATPLLAEGREPVDVQCRTFSVSRDAQQGWHFEDSAGGELPASLQRIEVGGYRSNLFYPRACERGFGSSTDGPLIGIMRHERLAILDEIRSRCSELPASQIGSDAFQIACLEWCRQATMNRDCRDEIDGFCKDHCPTFANPLDAGEFAATQAPEWRGIAELKKRWRANARVDGLFGLPFLSWAVAMSLVWRGLGRHLPVSLNEESLTELALNVRRLAPKLFDHDLVKLCTIEFLCRVYRRTG